MLAVEIWGVFVFTYHKDPCAWPSDGTRALQALGDH